MSRVIFGGLLRTVGVALAPLIMLTNAATGNEFSRQGHLVTVAVAAACYLVGWVAQREGAHQVGVADQRRVHEPDADQRGVA